MTAYWGYVCSKAPRLGQRPRAEAAAFDDRGSKASGGYSARGAWLPGTSAKIESQTHLASWRSTQEDTMPAN